MTQDQFPFQIPDRLPERVDPCPIVEAVLEIRFITEEAWSVLPGLLYNRIREHYPEKIELPLSQLPEDFRRREAHLTYQPLIQFLGQDFVIQFGPRVVSLVTKPDAYPGWQRIRKELAWLLEALKAAAFISEGERLGVRAINFFSGNVFPHLLIGGHVGDAPLNQTELTLTTAFRRPPLAGRLVVTNGALVNRGSTQISGSVLDLDVWASSLDFDLFVDGLEKFDDLHFLSKGLFFGLLQPDFLLTLNPIYP